MMNREPDWIDLPVWTPEKLEAAAKAAERKKEMEWLNSQPDYQWYVGYGGTE
jgi:hypothetical protein